MPFSQKAILNPLIPLASLALVASACGEGESAEAAEPHTLFTTVEGEPWCGAGDDTHVISSGADLVGPHFALSVMCRHTGGAVPESIAAEVAELRDLAVADGQEILINQLALQPNLEPEAGDGEVEAWIQAGDERLDLDAVPIGGATVAVTVASDEDAVLWVSDQDREQGLNLRTGEQVDPVPGYYDGVATEAGTLDPYRYEDVSVLNSSDAYKLTCVGGLEVARKFWLDEQGWAEDGSAFITVRTDWCGEFDGVLRWDLDQDAAFALAAGDKALEPVAWIEGEAADGKVQVTAVFRVPVDQTEFGIEFTPVGNLKNLDGGDDYAFAETPETTEWELSL